MKKLQVLLLMLFISLFFACKSAPKPVAESEKPKQAVEEKIEQPAQAATQVEETKPMQEAEPVRAPDKTDYTIYFAPLSYAIDRFTVQKLDDIAQTLAAQKVKRLIVSGHSAKLDSEKEEDRIALSRAQAVARYFQETGLFDAVDIRIEGKGAREPAASHTEITDRFKNRRVEIQSAE